MGAGRSVPGRWVAGCWVSGCWVAGCWVSGCWVAGCWVAGCVIPPHGQPRRRRAAGCRSSTFLPAAATPALQLRRSGSGLRVQKPGAGLHNCTQRWSCGERGKGKRGKGEKGKRGKGVKNGLSDWILTEARSKSIVTYRIGSDQIGSNRTGSGRIGPDRTGSDRIVPDRT